MITSSASPARPRTRVLALLTLLLAAVPFAACEPKEENNEQSGPQEPMPPVDLPPVPDIDFSRPISYADGSWSVWGLTQHRDEFLNHSVRLTGYVLEVYRCENREAMEAYDAQVRAGDVPPDGTGFGAERCNYPHLYIGDLPNATERMLITGYEA
ncbi:MAG: hypothetical protein KC561_08650, partial [Myxococcales bacterium]|nr:hypothetical protein [Myxococcales bacterium]